MRFSTLALCALLPTTTVGVARWSTLPLDVPHARHGPVWGVRSRLASCIPSPSVPPVSALLVRGGSADATTAEPETQAKEGEVGDEPSLDEKVHAAMRRLGLSPPGEEGAPAASSVESKEKDGGDGAECNGGVCELPTATAATTALTEPEEEEEVENVNVTAERIASDMNVDKSIAMAAIGATTRFDEGNTKVDEDAARAMIQTELDAMKKVSEDSDEVKLLISEGHDPLLARRALAFAEMNVDDARAILVADQEDEEMERREAEERAKAEEAAREEEEARARLRAEAEAKKKKKEAEMEMKTVTVDSNFDPTAGAAGGAAGLAGLGAKPPQAPQQQPGMPPMPSPAKKSDVVFEVTSQQIQSVVMESPVPVLLDVYADWCGPCKALTPALEQMAVKAGGAFRLVKVNSDNERGVSTALEVTALPTVFGIRDGKVVNMFQGMPRDEEFMKDFMMGLLMPGGTFNPPLTAEQKQKFAELSSKLSKVAGSACFSFSARERLQDRTVSKLDELVEAYGGDMADAEESARITRSLLSNVIRDPYDVKFRRINLENKVVASRVAQYGSCLSILKSVGFVPEDETNKALVLGKGKKVVNIAPLLVARDCIDKWIDQNRYKIAAEKRRKKDEIDRARLAAELEKAALEKGDDEEEDEQEEIDPNACTIKLRLDGKKKVHNLVMNANDSISAIIDSLPGPPVEEGQVVQITCAARRLVVKSTDPDAMGKTLREHGLAPAASVVVKVGDGSASSKEGRSSLAERAAGKQSKKKGSHTMQSVGIYAKDDNAKGELIDGGGGVWFEHDVSDDEEETGETLPKEEEDTQQEEDDIEEDASGKDAKQQ